jgi:putative hydrolase of the HAD superfamily
MSPSVITFDCAQTLVNATWDPVGMAKDAAEAIELPVSAEDLKAFGKTVRASWPKICAANETREFAPVDEVWLEITRQWLVSIGQDPGLAGRLKEVSDRFSFHHPSRYFSIYDDVVPSLTRLQLGGYRLAVISNWDRSLPWVLDLFGLRGFFEVVTASLVEGFEKPDQRIFHLTLERMGVRPEDAVHVGDDLVDDVRGAKDAGMKAVLLDRSLVALEKGKLHSLSHLEEAMAWND